MYVYIMLFHWQFKVGAGVLVYSLIMGIFLMTSQVASKGAKLKETC